MAKEVTVIHQVRAGIPSEYQASFIAEADNDTLMMSFEGIITIDNIVVYTEANSDYDVTLDLLYPTSEKELSLLNDKPISGVNPSVWSLNARDPGNSFGTADSGKLWFNVPSGTTLRCQINSWSAEGQLTLLAIGM